MASNNRPIDLGVEEIDVLAVARRVVDDPRKLYTISARETLALCSGVLLLAEAAEGPTTNAQLAAAIAIFLRAESDLTASRGPDGYTPLPIFKAHHEAFATLKTLFETEFPNV